MPASHWHICPRQPEYRTITGEGEPDRTGPVGPGDFVQLEAKAAHCAVIVGDVRELDQPGLFAGKVQSLVPPDAIDVKCGDQVEFRWRHVHSVTRNEFQPRGAVRKMREANPLHWDISHTRAGERARRAGDQVILRYGACSYDISIVECGDPVCTGIVRAVRGHQAAQGEHVRTGDTVEFERRHVFKLHSDNA